MATARSKRRSAGPSRQVNRTLRQRAGRSVNRKTQEREGGPRGEALDQTSRSSGLAVARSARGGAARSTGNHCATKTATPAKGDAATAQSAQQSRTHEESAGAFE